MPVRRHWYQRLKCGAVMSAVEVAERFASAQVAPHASRWELERHWPLDALKAAASAGLTGLLVPAEMGGQDLGCRQMAGVMEKLAAADMCFAFALVVHNNLMGNIARNGSIDQRERWLPDLMSMKRVGTFLLTEPQSGSDAANVQTTATREGNEWVLNGAKAWASNGAGAQTLSVYAQTNPDAGARGVACFLVDADNPGVVRNAPYQMLGGHALGASGFRFEKCRIPESDMLVAPGQGFKAAMAGIDIARANVAAMCASMLRTSLNCALEYTKTHHAFGQSLFDHQGLQWSLADVATDCYAARLMAYDACDQIDAGGQAATDAAHAKKFATRVALRGISQCMQAMGANGMTHDYPLARHFASAKIAQYLDGTTEIQNVVISRALQRGPVD